MEIINRVRVGNSVGGADDPTAQPNAGEADPAPQAVDPPLAPFDAEAAIRKLSDEVAKLRQPTNNVPANWREFAFAFPSSGLFFILMGTILLTIAHWRIETTHAAFTFVLVVLGVAVLLYGTGTQAAGNFNSDTTVAKYNIAIAGGAGILALCTALGMVTYFREMADAFQVEKKYVRVLIKSSDDAAKISSYTSQFTIEGNPVPSAVRGNSYVEVYVPWISSELHEPLKTRSADAAAQQAESARKQPQAKLKSKGVGCKTAKDEDKIQEVAADDDDGVRTKRIYGTFYRILEDNNDAVGYDKRSSKFSRFKDIVSHQFDIKLSTASFRSLSRGNDFPDYEDTFCVNLLNEKQPEALQTVTISLTNSPASGKNFNAEGAPLADTPNATEPAQLVAK